MKFQQMSKCSWYLENTACERKWAHIMLFDTHYFIEAYNSPYLAVNKPIQAIANTLEEAKEKAERLIS